MTGEQLKEEIRRTGLSISNVAREIGFTPSAFLRRMKIKGNIAPDLVAKVNAVIAPYKENCSSDSEIIRALRQEVALLLQQNTELHKIIDNLTNIDASK